MTLGFQQIKNWFMRSNQDVQHENIQLLRDSDVFKGLRPIDYRQLNDLFHEVNYSQGERIFSEGDPSSAMYLVKRGAVEIFQENVNGEEVHLTTLRDGDFFGELALCTKHRRTTSARAEEPTQLLGIFRQEMIEFSQKQLRCGVNVMMNLLSIVGDRMLEANQRIIQLQSEKSDSLTDEESTQSV